MNAIQTHILQFCELSSGEQRNDNLTLTLQRFNELFSTGDKSKEKGNMVYNGKQTCDLFR